MSGRAKAIWRQSGKSNLAPICNSGQIILSGKNNFQSGNDQSGRLTLGFLVPDWTQSSKALKRKIANSNLGQSGQLGQIEADLARLLWLGQQLSNIQNSCWVRTHLP